jgi:hypothetical protein
MARKKRMSSSSSSLPSRWTNFVARLTGVEHLERGLQEMRRDVAVRLGELGGSEAGRAAPERQQAVVVQRDRRGHRDERSGGHAIGGDGEERERAAHAVAEEVQPIAARLADHDGSGAWQSGSKVSITASPPLFAYCANAS